MRTLATVILLLGLILGIASCEKVLDVNIPDGAVGIVFEGYIENGAFPYVIITRSENYFAPITTTTEAILSTIVQGAVVSIEVDGAEYPMTETCLSTLPPEAQAQAMSLLGFDTIPPGLDICIYLNTSLIGELGKSYRLRAQITEDGTMKEYTALTHVYQSIALDSLWFKLQPPEDSLGYIWCTLTDPDTLGNYYYMWTKRLNHSEGFMAVPGASFGDRFFNGQSFDFNFARSTRFGDSVVDDDFYRTDDTVVVKLGAMDKGVYDFWESASAAASGGGNPFASPTTVVSNFDNGGRGVWAGYAVTFDTIVCHPVQ